MSFCRESWEIYLTERYRHHSIFYVEEKFKWSNKLKCSAKVVHCEEAIIQEIPNYNPSWDRKWWFGIKWYAIHLGIPILHICMFRRQRTLGHKRKGGGIGWRRWLLSSQKRLHTFTKSSNTQRTALSRVLRHLSVSIWVHRKLPGPSFCSHVGFILDTFLTLSSVFLEIKISNLFL